MKTIKIGDTEHEVEDDIFKAVFELGKGKGQEITEGKITKEFVSLIPDDQKGQQIRPKELAELIKNSIKEQLAAKETEVKDVKETSELSVKEQIATAIAEERKTIKTDRHSDAISNLKKEIKAKAIQLNLKEDEDDDDIFNAYIDRHFDIKNNDGKRQDRQGGRCGSVY